MEHSSKMEHSCQNGTHTHIKMEFIKMEPHQTWNSLKRNTHIITLWCTYNNLVTVRYVFGRNLRSSLLLAKVCIFLTEKETHQNGILLLSKWNTHIIIKIELIKMEHSYYYQNGTHQKGTLIKKEHSSKRNTHIKMEPSSKWNPHQKWNSLNRNIHIIKKKKKKKRNTHHGMGTLISKALSAT